LGHEAKWEYFRVMYERYRKAEAKSRGGLLNEFCSTTGYNRKYAIRLLNGPPPGAGAEETVARTPAALWQAGGFGLGGGMAGGRLSLVGAAEGAAAQLAAVDSQALPAGPGDRAAVTGHQRAADGSAAGGQETGAEAQDLRAHQAGYAADVSTVLRAAEIAGLRGSEMLPVISEKAH
jgi:hypothetical protein